MSPDPCYHWQDEILLLNVYIQPRASRDEIVGLHGNELKIRLTAPPVDGKANAQLIKFLAKTFGVNRSQIEILSGESSRHKRLAICAPVSLPTVLST